MDEFDAAGSRENLAVVCEMRGNLRRAKQLRRIGAPDRMLCSNYTVRSLMFLSIYTPCNATRSSVLSKP